MLLWAKNAGAEGIGRLREWLFNMRTVEAWLVSHVDSPEHECTSQYFSSEANNIHNT